MRILFAGGEDESIDRINALVDTGATHYRPGYARHALHPLDVDGLRHVFRGRLKTYLDAQPSGNKEFYYGYRFRGGGGATTSGISLKMYDSSAIPKPFLRLKAPGANNLMMELSNDGFVANVTQFPASTIIQPTAAPSEWVFHVKIHPTDGRIRWIADGTVWFDTGPMNTTSLCVGSPSETRWSKSNSNGDDYISEVRASTATSPCINWDIATLAGTLDGFYTDWSGGVASINEQTKDSSTLLTSTDAGQKSSFIPSDIPASVGAQVILGVVLSGNFFTSEGAPTGITEFLRISGNDYFDVLQTIPYTEELRQAVYELSPASGVFFDTTELRDNTEYCVRSET